MCSSGAAQQVCGLQGVKNQQQVWSQRAMMSQEQVCSQQGVKSWQQAHWRKQVCSQAEVQRQQQRLGRHQTVKNQRRVWSQQVWNQ